MNQQRARRFKTAIEQRQAAEKADRQSSSTETEERQAEPFDSNCITPGTGGWLPLGCGACAAALS